MKEFKFKINGKDFETSVNELDDNTIINNLSFFVSKFYKCQQYLMALVILKKEF